MIKITKQIDIVNKLTEEIEWNHEHYLFNLTNPKGGKKMEKGNKEKMGEN